MVEPADFMTIGDYSFPVEDARFTGYLEPPNFLWQIRIWAKEGELHGETASPYAYSEDILPFHNRILGKWQDLLTEEIAWEECFNEARRQWHAGIYLFTHDQIDNGLIRFENIKGEMFRAFWSGAIDTTAAEAFEKYDDEIPFYCEANIRFCGVTVKGIGIEEASSIIAKFITNQAFSFHKSLGRETHLYLPDVGARWDGL
jgi:hypothetical protein